MTHLSKDDMEKLKDGIEILETTFVPDNYEGFTGLGYRISGMSGTEKTFQFVISGKAVSKKQKNEYIDISNDCWLHSSHGGLEEHAHLDILVNKKTKDFALRVSRMDIEDKIYKLETEKMAEHSAKDYYVKCKVNLPLSLWKQ